jgi:predicted nuclease of predicted toxin-antitoxin system
MTSRQLCNSPISSKIRTCSEASFRCEHFPKNLFTWSKTSFQDRFKSGFSGETADKAIWEYAKDQDFTIVTSDIDFVRLSGRFGPRPKVIRFERMDYSTTIVADLIRRRAIVISEFGKSADGILVLRRTQ